MTTQPINRCLRIAVMLACAINLTATAQDSLPIYQWDVRPDRLQHRPWSILRQEAVVLEPTFIDRNLSEVYEVVMRWRPYESEQSWNYATNGIVVDAAAGIVQAVWLPSFDADTADAYDYEIALKSALGQNLRARGIITMQGSLADAPVTELPTALEPFDWSLWDHINIEFAPFLLIADAPAGMFPRAGIWGLNGDGELTVLPHIIDPAAGLWHLTNGEITLSGNDWPDAWWEIIDGQVQPKEIP